MRAINITLFALLLSACAAPGKGEDENKVGSYWNQRNVESCTTGRTLDHSPGDSCWRAETAYAAEGRFEEGLRLLVRGCMNFNNTIACRGIGRVPMKAARSGKGEQGTFVGVVGGGVPASYAG